MDTLLRVLHVLGAAVFFGSMLVNRRVKKAGEAAGDPAVLKFTYATVRRNDLVFGTPGMLAVLVGGLGLVALQPALARQVWFHASMGLMLVVLGAWMGLQVPAQVKLSKLESMDDPARPGLSGKWDLGQGLTALATLAVLVLMVARHSLP